MEGPQLDYLRFKNVFEQVRDCVDVVLRRAGTE
jgi:hypothetical protein